MAQLSPGASLSHYRIASQLGAGGMGEVYLAHDTKLDRKVALKILPADLAANQDRMRRFTQEAKSAAALNHPNIATIHEIGESAGVNFIAMEFIDGVTLRHKIHQEQTDLRKLLRYLQHVAEGLAKAHAAGIVHRDLKPDNIMVTRRHRFGVGGWRRHARRFYSPRSHGERCLYGQVRRSRARGQTVRGVRAAFGFGKSSRRLYLLFRPAIRRSGQSGKEGSRIGSSVAHQRLGSAYEQTGMFPEAIAEFQKAVDGSNRVQLAVASLAHAFALAGKRAEAEKLLAELKERSGREYVSSYLIAEIYVALGEKEAAFKSLDMAYDERSIDLVLAKVDPRLDPLRDDPRFQELLKKVGIPQ